MGQSIQSRPNTWNAVKNPVLYKIRREDFLYNQVNNALGVLEIQWNAVNLTAYFLAGASIYIKSNDGLINGVFDIGSISFTGVNTIAELNTPYVASVGGGVSNSPGQRTDWKLFVEVFKASNNASLTGGVQFTFTAKVSDYISLVDVSTIIKPYVSADWIKPVSTADPATHLYQRVYIKYQEFYDGILQGAVISDSANPRNYVHAAMQIRGNTMLQYAMDHITPAKWLTKFVSPSLWRSWPSTLCFIRDGSGAIITLVAAHYGDDLTIPIGGNAVGLPDPAGVNELAVNRVDLNGAWNPIDPTFVKKMILRLYDSYTALISDPNFTIGAGSWTSIGLPGWSVGFTGFTQNVLTYPNGLSGNFLSAAFAVAANKKVVKIRGNLLRLGGSPQGTVRVDFLDNVGGPIPNMAFVFPYSLSLANPALNLALDAIVDDTIGAKNCRLLVIFGTGSGQPGDSLQTRFTTVDCAFISGDLMEPITIQVKDACSYDSTQLLPEFTAVELQWTNSTGGDSQWVFENFHEVTNTNGHKGKRLLLVAENLTPDEWDSLNELNSFNEVYRNNVTELLTTTDKSHTRLGQQVYMLKPDGTKTGVIVVFNTTPAITRRVKHRIEIVIELPEIYE
jgi:hypothetical protein